MFKQKQQFSPNSKLSFTFIVLRTIKAPYAAIDPLTRSLPSSQVYKIPVTLRLTPWYVTKLQNWFFFTLHEVRWDNKCLASLFDNVDLMMMSLPERVEQIAAIKRFKKVMMGNVPVSTVQGWQTRVFARKMQRCFMMSTPFSCFTNIFFVPQSCLSCSDLSPPQSLSTKDRKRFSFFHHNYYVKTLTNWGKILWRVRKTFFVVSACFQVFLVVRLTLSTVFCCRDRLRQGHLVVTSRETLIVLI